MHIHTIHTHTDIRTWGVKIYTHTCTFCTCMYLTLAYMQYKHAILDAYTHAHAGSLMEEHLVSPRRGPGDKAAAAPAHQAPLRAAHPWQTPPGRRLTTRPARRYVIRAGGAGLPQPPHAALRRGMQMGFDSPEQHRSMKGTNSTYNAKGRGRKM